MGSKKEILRKLLKRDLLVIKNNNVINHLNKIAERFNNGTLFINSDCIYDFSNNYFDMDITIEIDSRATIEDVKRIIYSFKKARLHLAVYEAGITGNIVNKNIDEFIQLEDKNHRIFLFAYKADAKRLNIPKEYRLYSEDTFPPCFRWDYYMVKKNALKFSKKFYKRGYITCGKCGASVTGSI